MDKSKKPQNDIRIGFRSRTSSILTYCDKLLKENQVKTLNFSAVGGSIGTLVNVVEILKMTTPGFYQLNRIATISYQSVEEGGNVQNQRLYPKLEVILTLEKPSNETEGYQAPLTEDERKKLIELRDKRRQERANNRGRARRFTRGRGRPMRGGRRRGRPMRGGRGRPMRGGRGRPMRGGRGRPMRAVRMSNRGGRAIRRPPRGKW